MWSLYICNFLRILYIGCIIYWGLYPIFLLYRSPGLGGKLFGCVQNVDGTRRCTRISEKIGTDCVRFDRSPVLGGKLLGSLQNAGTRMYTIIFEKIGIDCILF